MEITKEFLKKHNVCNAGYKWWLKNCQELSTFEQISKIAEHDYTWVNWVIIRLMTHSQKIIYAIIAAELVIATFEKKYPDNKYPQQAIHAAKNYLKKPSKIAANAAGMAAAAAINAVIYPDYTDCVPAVAANAAAVAADAAYVAAAADDATDATMATTAAINAAIAVDATIKNKIIKYGIELLK